MRQLRHWLIYNWHLKLISLILAVMLWMVVATETSSELGMEVPLEYRNIPAQLEIAGDTTNTVQVRLRGSSNVIRDISAKIVSPTIATVPIRLDRRQTHIEQAVDLDVPDPQIRLRRPAPVAVRVEIRRRGQR